MSNLLPGDELVYLGTPYDTLHKAIGDQGDEPGSMIEMGVRYREIVFDFEKFDLRQVTDGIHDDTKILAIQRSKGYNWRKSLFVDEIGQIIKAAKAKKPDLIVFVDNCYG